MQTSTSNTAGDHIKTRFSLSTPWNQKNGACNTIASNSEKLEDGFLKHPRTYHLTSNKSLTQSLTRRAHSWKLMVTWKEWSLQVETQNKIAADRVKMNTQKNYILHKIISIFHIFYNNEYILQKWLRGWWTSLETISTTKGGERNQDYNTQMRTTVPLHLTAGAHGRTTWEFNAWSGNI